MADATTKDSSIQSMIDGNKRFNDQFSVRVSEEMVADDLYGTIEYERQKALVNDGAAPLNRGVRQFSTGATRDEDGGKPDYEGFLSPLVIERYGQFMHKHRLQSDGRLRDSDNWQKGIPLDAYIKSGFRHFVDWWKEHRGIPTTEGIEDALCAILFNASGYLHEHLRKRGSYGKDSD